MSNQLYTLQIQLGDYEPGRIVADDDSGWIMATYDYLNHRGSVKEGELAMLLDYARDNKLTSILEPFGDES